ncbi:DUF3427 domain-containing protein [Gammaproteobacteria bacterium]|nr:DUF3427 domain-containing protein [Gammaproteobacteria bacterium]
MSKLIDIPNQKLDKILKEKISKSNKVIILVSFSFVSGLRLILEELKSFKKKSHLIFITSNYLKSTQPEALEILLDLKKEGAKVYFYDSLSSGKSFHMKSYGFKFTNLKSSLIIGSSNISLSAFRNGNELNIEDKRLKTFKRFEEIANNIIKDEFTKPLTIEVINEYKGIYENNENIFLKVEQSYEELKPISFKEPNFAQKDALEVLKANREEGVKKGLVVMATGLGKTILSILDIINFKAKKVLFVAHREEILKQSIESFKQFIPNKSYGFYQSSKKDFNSDYLFASIMTIGKKNELKKFKKDEFDYIVVDEFHHAGAKSYRNLLEYFSPRFFLGLTATPNRSDNIDVLQFLDNNLIYRKDLIDGINLGILSMFDYFGINDKHVDYTKITWRGNKFDDLEIEENLITSKRAEYIFENWKSLKQTRTLAFCSSIRHSDFMSDFFSSKGIKCLSMHSKSEINRSESIEKLRKGEIEILFSVDLFNEGVDIPAVDTILMIRPTESKIIFLQQFGRGLRKAEGKEKVVVIDFIGNHKSFLEKPSALFGFDLNPNNIREFIKQYNENSLNIPKGSRILYDPESLDFMTELSRTNQNFVSKYKEYKEDNGERPSASEFYQFIDKLSQVKSQFGSWFDFIQKMDDLNSEQSKAFRTNKRFLKELETTRMTKSFKMVVIDILCKNNFNSMDLDELYKKSFDYLKQTTNLWNELPTQFKTETLTDDNYSNWKKYWLSNPISALIKTSSQFFEIKENNIYTNLDRKNNFDKFLDMCKELIGYRFLSYKINYDSSYVEMGNVDKNYSHQIGKAFKKTDIPKLFKFSGEASNEGFYKMFGHARPPKVPHQFIFITLIKASMAAEHRYHDYFKSEKLFHWQSRNTTTQSNEAGLAIINHIKNKNSVHLFVRKMSSINGKTLPFTYCGKMNFRSVNGNSPINVDFELEIPLNEKLKQEFFRI